MAKATRRRMSTDRPRRNPAAARERTARSALVRRDGAGALVLSGGLTLKGEAFQKGVDECLVLEAAASSQSTIIVQAADAIFGELGTANPRWREDVSHNAKLWFLVVNGDATSCALFSQRDGGPDAIVHMLATAPDCRRHGFASTLVDYVRAMHATTDAGQVFVEVSAASDGPRDARTTAQLFWHHEGFIEQCAHSYGPKLFPASILLVATAA